MEEIKCDICGTTEHISRKTRNNKFNMILCNKHHHHLERYGKILNRTDKDPNEIIIDSENEYAYVVLYNECSAGEEPTEKCRTIIDVEDIDRIKDYKWYENNGYVNCKNKSLQIHRLIMDCPDDMVVDHKDGDPLNNRKYNLRISTQGDNGKNLKKKINNSSGVSGVWYEKSRNKWVAEIKVNYVKTGMKRFDNFEDAVKHRKELEEKYFGEFNREEEFKDKNDDIASLKCCICESTDLKTRTKTNQFKMILCKNCYLKKQQEKVSK